MPIRGGAAVAWLAAAAAALLSLAFDRYSYGQIGGHPPTGYRPLGTSLQPVIALAMATLLSFGAAVGFRRLSLARKLLVAEAAVFLIANLAIIARDGGWRWSAGYEHSNRGGWLLLAGAAARAVMLWLSRPQEDRVVVAN